jgi:ribosomal protein L10
MTTLRKQILYSKIQNILARNYFVLFFQFNNIKFKQWILLKNQIKSIENTTIVVIKNKITYETLNKHMVIHQLNTSKKKFSSVLTNKYISINENITVDLNTQVCFLCQGPTLLIAFKSSEQCKTIYEIINAFTYNLPYTKHQLESKKNFSSLAEFKASSLENRKLPFIFIKNKLTLESRKSNLLNLDNDKFSLFFIGGLIRNKIINHLDLKKLANLDNSVYVYLIQQCHSPVAWFPFLKVVMEVKLLKCFENKFINLLNIHKSNLEKLN